MLQDGPWMILGIPIFLNKWSPSVSLLMEEFLWVPVWVKFHDVPLVAYTSDGLDLISMKTCDNLVMAVPNLEGNGSTKKTIRIEYECEPPRNSFEALNVESPIIEKVTTGSKAITSGTQEEGENATHLVERINVLEKHIMEENLCLWMMVENQWKRLIIQIIRVATMKLNQLIMKQQVIWHQNRCGLDMVRKALLEQWRENEMDDDYDPYDDNDMYKGVHGGDNRDGVGGGGGGDSRDEIIGGSGGAGFVVVIVGRGIGGGFDDECGFRRKKLIEQSHL
ncbi:zinc knuckle CX2CX4HX4C containing protein [Tanacetum coccineum]